MKLLKKLLLINWHYIQYEEIEFGNINFLTGKNAAGKSTIIDALELLILGDTSGHFFNRAANDNSKRTLKGYLKGELADDGQAGFIYLREGVFSSYIAGEFYDTTRKSSITFGVVFDVDHDEKPLHKFFLLEGSIPENKFIQNNTPMSYKELRAHFNSSDQVKYQFFDSNKSYQQVFRAKMGSLNEKFFSIFRKAVPFSPIMDIQRFISEFVCDVRNKIDIVDMQDNIRYYKQLEQEVELVKKRIDRLENIEEKFNQYAGEEERFKEQSYLMDRALEHEKEDVIARYNETIEKNRVEIVKQRELLEVKREEKQVIEAKRDELLEEKYNSDIYKKSRSLQIEKERLTREMSRLESIMTKIEKKLKNIGYLWRENTRAYTETIGNQMGQPGEELIASLQEDAQYLLGINRENIKDISITRLEESKCRMKKYKEKIDGLYFENHHILHEIQRKEKELDQQIHKLKKGIKSYSPRLLELQKEIQSALSARYNKDINVYIFCECMELKDKKWQKAIEGYLHTQKFYLIVEPEYFLEALKTYDRLKFEKRFYDFGLVDIEKIVKRSPVAEEGSLAEEIVADNHYARVLVDFLLGRVMKSETVTALRNYRTAITESGMLYQNFTARQLNPDRWKIPFIGKHSIEEQIRIKEEEREKLLQEKKTLTDREKILGNLREIEVINDDEIINIKGQLQEIESWEILQDELKKIIEAMGQIDLTYLDSIDRAIEELKIQKEKVEKDLRECDKAINKLEYENMILLQKPQKVL